MSPRMVTVSVGLSGFLSAVLLTGCGGSTPATGDAAAMPPAQSEQEYQKQQDQIRKDNMARAKAAKGLKK